MKSKCILSIFAAILFAGNLSAQTDFFMSMSDLNTGAVNEHLNVEFAPGDSGSIYIYYTTNGPANSDIDTGVFLDVATSDVGVVEFNQALSLNFDLTFFGSVLGERWDGAFGLAQSVTADSVNEMGAFVLFTGQGIREENNGLGGGVADQGYDVGADAFLFGRIDFDIPVDAVPGSSVDLIMSSGSGLIINSGAVVPATFGGATFSIGIEEVMGDVNGDGQVGMDDVKPFIQLIINREFQNTADINQDGVVNLLDVRPFVELLMP